MLMGQAHAPYINKKKNPGMFGPRSQYTHLGF